MSDASAEVPLPGAMPAEAETRPVWRRINWRNASFLLSLHLLAVLAFFPWYFSWTGVVLCVTGIFVYGMLGVNIGYHRLLTHRAFVCSLWLERTLSVLGVCCGQESPAYWVAIHRRHHHHADDVPDPHTPLVSFLWSHVGWLLVKSRDLDRYPLMDRYARDVRRDPFQAWLVKGDHFMLIIGFSWLAYYLVGLLIGLATGMGLSGASQFGASLFVWGAALRSVLLLHFTWSVNSAAHMWGYRNYKTGDDSRNNAVVAILTHGEGWHNNHHADPRSARHGHKWWEFDLSWQTIRLFMALGWARDPVLPSPGLAAKFEAGGGDEAR